MKIHFGNSDIQLERAEHLLRLQQFFRVVNDHKMAIVIHLRVHFQGARLRSGASAPVPRFSDAAGARCAGADRPPGRCRARL
ncbi:hypothetical protein LP420_33275 [Massilia sp. B-10]|nr:hypothetical protein LP420_33275 [Massilia sp. B-10]